MSISEYQLGDYVLRLEDDSRYPDQCRGTIFGYIDYPAGLELKLLASEIYDTADDAAEAITAKAAAWHGNDCVARWSIQRRIARRPFDTPSAVV